MHGPPFRSLVDGLLGHDPFFVLAEHRAYVDAQREEETAWRDVPVPVPRNGEGE